MKNQLVEDNDIAVLTAKDLATDQEIRWCPGCGDYSILKQVQTVLPEMGVPREKMVFVSGIGCSSRFPYYMNTYGMHSIHGRAMAIASGLRLTNSDLQIWVITGDGDGLSIGGNHFLHTLRRNFNLNVILFNNEIYGLTKGQYSPTSEVGKVTKSTPIGSIDHPINPVAVALGADGTFIARSMDRDPKHLKEMLRRTAAHKGTSMLEVYQNCNVFNDGAFAPFTDKKTKADTTLMLQDGQPLIFGSENDKGIILDDYRPRVVQLQDGDVSMDDLWVHDESNLFKANILSRFFERPEGTDFTHYLPRPFGVFYAVDRPTYEDGAAAQLEQAYQKHGKGDLAKLLAGDLNWKL